MYKYIMILLKNIFGCSDDFEFENKNSEHVEILGKMSEENMYGI